MKYNVILSPEAEQDLREIFEYISTELIEPEAATSLCDRISEMIFGLKTLPNRSALYKKEPWKSRGLRFFPVGNFIVYYLVRESDLTVHIIRILYGGRDVHTILS